MLTSNVPRRELRDEVAQSEALMLRLLRVYRAARMLATGAESLGNRTFRELRAGDLLFLRDAVEAADPWVRKEAGR